MVYVDKIWVYVEVGMKMWCLFHGGVCFSLKNVLVRCDSRVPLRSRRLGETLERIQFCSLSPSTKLSVFINVPGKLGNVPVKWGSEAGPPPRRKDNIEELHLYPANCQEGF